MVYLDPLTRLRLQRGAEHLCRLGPRATAEFLGEVADRVGGMPCILDRLREYECRLSPAMLRLTCGDRFPPRPLHLVPPAMMRFARRPRINWGPPPSPRQRRNWCGLCRRPSGPLFDVSDAVWLFYVGYDHRHQILCIGCWRWLANVIDGGAFEREHGGPVPLWSSEFRRRHGIPPNEPSPWDGTTVAEGSL